jgi:2-octaprenylphenol hydroxylase
MSDPQAKSLDYDVIVAGGGMVGASFALALADSGLRIALVDSQDLGNFAEQVHCAERFDPRVSAITPASAAFLESLGVWQGVRERRCSPYTDMHVWDADGTGSIHFNAQEIHAPALGHIVENTVLLAALYERISATANIDVLAPVTLNGLALDTAQERVGITLEDGRSISATLLVAADGANSKVRELAGFKTKEWDYEHQAIVTTVKTELPHGATAIQRFMDQGTLAFLPLQQSAAVANSQQYCSIVWSVLPDYAQSLMALDDADFAKRLEAAIENKLGKIEHLETRFSFPLRQRHAVDYVQPGIALIGDAAHTIHPLAGQGVNLGFLDAQALAEEVQRTHSQHLAIGDLRFLRRYQRRRIGHNLGMMWVMEGFKRLFADQPLPLRWLRNAGMSGLDRSAVIKHQLMRSAMGME